MKESYEKYLAREEARKRDVERSKREEAYALENLNKTFARLFDASGLPAQIRDEYDRRRKNNLEINKIADLL